MTVIGMLIFWSLGLTTEGISWCESLNTDSLSWPAVRELLRSKYPAILDRFAGLERIDESTLSDIRLARKAGGFAFEYWCMGGDINDIERLIEHLSTVLGNDRFLNDFDHHNFHTRQRVFTSVTWNAETVAGSSPKVEVWNLPLSERRRLLQRWKEEIDPRLILDRTAEIHRRHQAAVSKKYQARHDIDARCLLQRELSLFPTRTYSSN